MKNSSSLDTYIIAQFVCLLVSSASPSIDDVAVVIKLNALVLL